MILRSGLVRLISNSTRTRTVSCPNRPPIQCPMEPDRLDADLHCPCPQALCNASSHVVSRNPAQIVKEVRSAAPAMVPVLQAL